MSIRIPAALLTLFFGALMIWSDGTRSVSSSSTYFVSPHGNNNNPGTREQPWRSPGYASRKLKPGDTMILLYGKYVLSRYDEDILIPPTGRPGDWITIRGESKKKLPVLAGRDNLPTAIDLSGVSYVRVENLEITCDASAKGGRRWFRDGIAILDEPSSNIFLRNLYIHHLDEFGLNVQDVQNMRVLNCRIEYCGFGSAGGPAGEDGGWRNVLIRGCSLSYGGHYYQGGDGSARPYERPDGLGVEPSDGPVDIIRTIAEHNRGDGLDSKTAKTTIRRCVVANNSCDGVKLWGGGSRIENSLIYGTGDGLGGSSPWAGIVIGTSSPNAQFEICNVTLHDNPERRAYILYVQYDDRDVPITVLMRNCIAANGYGLACFGPSVDLTADHNLFYRPGGGDQVEANGRLYTAQQLDALGSGNKYGDPAFVRPAWGEPGDYQLTRKSPARNSGCAKGAPAIDLDFTARPQGKGCDIGAYEWSAGRKMLNPPGKLKAMVKSDRRVLLKWQDNSSFETGFVIERAEGETGGWQTIGTVKAGKRKHEDTKLTSGINYRYRVRALTFSRSSRYSNVVSVVVDE